MIATVSSDFEHGAELLQSFGIDRTIWVISCIPEGRRREVTARQLRNATTYLIMPKKDICLQQIKNDTTRSHPESYGAKIVNDWYEKYTPSMKDKIMESAKETKCR